MVSIKEFPRGIEVVAKSGKSHASLKSDQVISGASATASVQRAPGPGLKLRHGGLTPEASGDKLQATSFKLQATSFKLQATSFKRQVKLQAASVGCGPNRQAPTMAFRDDRSGDRGSRMTHKVLLVQKRLPGL